MDRVRGFIAGSVARRLAMIVAGPALGLLLTVFATQQSNRARLTNEHIHDEIRSRQTIIEAVDADLTVLNSQIGGFLMERSATHAEAIATTLDAGISKLMRGRSLEKPGQTAKFGAILDRIEGIRTGFAKLDSVVGRVGRLSNEGLVRRLDESTELLLALFDGALSLDEGFRTAASTFAEIRGLELRYRWKRDPALLGRLVFLRKALNSLLGAAQLDAMQAKTLRSHTDTHNTLFEQWNLAVDEEGSLHITLLQQGAEVLGEARTVRTGLAETLLNERKRYADANEAASSMTLTAAALSALVSAAFVFLIGRGITRDLSALASSMRRVAAEEVGVAVPAQQRADEIGAMARALRIFQNSLAERTHLASLAERTNAERLKRAEHIEGTVRDFSEAATRSISCLRESATAMHASAHALSDVSECLVEKAEDTGVEVASASHEVGSVAVTTSQMTAAVHEVSWQAGRSTEVADKAVADSGRASALMRELVLEASRIGDVVRLIQSVTEQTNLLALNATIEAARAGVAGKGFAVVASEVKALAAQTTRATEEISERVGAIQSASAEVGSAIETVEATLNELNSIAASVAAAVEEQSCAIDTISQNVNSAARSTERGALAMTEARSLAGGAMETSHRVAQSATTVARETAEMERCIETFIASLKVA